MTDDPGARVVVAKKGVRRIEKKADNSKSSTSVMFCGNAAGQLIPPTVVYKLAHVYKGWVEGGPLGASYDCTDSGWFDSATFQKWFYQQFLSLVERLGLSGPIALIGD